MMTSRADAGIRGARSFDEFYRAVEQTGPVAGTNKTYTPQEIRNLTEAVRQGDYESDVLTRAGGIRETALRLMGEEAKARAEPQLDLSALDAEIDRLGGAKGSIKKYSPDELKGLVRSAVLGEESYKVITRSEGLRERVMKATGDFRQELEKQGYTPDRIFMDKITTSVPPEGFKLHVTSDPEYMRQVIATVSPLLNRMGVSHKFVGSMGAMEKVMTGTQNGKFVTVYPTSPQDALRLARVLDHALSGKGITGPRIPNDNPLPGGESGLVSYRYAANTTEYITGPDGELVEDKRDGPAVPPWIKDPFKEQR